MLLLLCKDFQQTATTSASHHIPSHIVKTKGVTKSVIGPATDMTQSGAVKMKCLASVAAVM